MVEVFNGLGVLALSHVCRLWRDMVVEEASLWSHINLCAGQRCVELSIQRSRGLPPTLHASLRKSSFSNEVLDRFVGMRDCNLAECVIASKVCGDEEDVKIHHVVYDDLPW